MLGCCQQSNRCIGAANAVGLARSQSGALEASHARWLSLKGRPRGEGGRAPFGSFVCFGVLRLRLAVDELASALGSKSSFTAFPAVRVGAFLGLASLGLFEGVAVALGPGGRDDSSGFLLVRAA